MRRFLQLYKQQERGSSRQQPRAPTYKHEQARRRCAHDTAPILSIVAPTAYATHAETAVAVAAPVMFVDGRKRA